MPTIRLVRNDRRKKESRYLLDHARKVESQYGEDGIIERILDIIGSKNGWCVEFGAWDGKHYSNTYNLIKNHGWRGVLIEGNKLRFNELLTTYEGNDRVHPICGIVGFDPERDSIDWHLKQSPIPKDFDFISIDIDGNDWHIWDSIQAYRPRIVMIEFNARIPNDVIYVQDRDFSINQGCSLMALIDLGKKKGYELAAATACNGIFVVKEEFPKLEIADNSIDAMYLAAGALGRLFYLYDGTLVNTGVDTIALRQANPDRRTIGPFDFQVYPEERRFYGGKVPITPE